jgi:hypothetical protein
MVLEFIDPNNKIVLQFVGSQEPSFGGQGVQFKTYNYLLRDRL